MTGFGVGRAEAPGLQVTAEVRAVNGRFFKANIKAPPLLASRESDLEAVLRDKLKRGSVNLSVHLKRTDPSRLAAVNSEAVLAYKAAFERLGVPTAVIGLLPGVLETANGEELAEVEWQAIVAATRAALRQLTEMREREGQAIAASLGGITARMDTVRAGVLARAPQVVVEYRQKLAARLSLLVDNGTAGVDPELVAREVAVFADRADVTEELARLAGHLEQARGLLSAGDDVGRRLDFLAQEMLREVNTIGSKSADLELARAVVELKSLVEQLKEQVANIE